MCMAARRSTCQADYCLKKARARQNRALACLCPVGGRGPSIEAEGGCVPHRVAAAGRVHAPFALRIVPLTFSQTSWTLVQCGLDVRERCLCEAFVRSLFADGLALSQHPRESRTVWNARSRRAGSHQEPVGKGRAGHGLMLIGLH
jgi:hypothetical protein